MIKSIFKIEKMDCPSEESLIRLKLQNFREISLKFDLENRILIVLHKEDVKLIDSSISSLNLNSKLLSSTVVSDSVPSNNNHIEKKILWIVLLINFLFFLIESLSGILSRSMGLVADSLDMLADALVYGMSLLAVGTSVRKKKQVARISGYLQIGLAVWGFTEVIKRFIGMETIPDYLVMIGISISALIANVLSLYFLQKAESKDAHIQASIIFSSNDIIINAGVILAGALVYFLKSGIPDLIVGSIVFLIVMRGAFRILKLSKNDHIA